jgi:alpha-L-fucosidase
MAAPYVTSAEILAHVGITSATAEDTAWAGKCAAAIEAIIAERLDTANVTLSAGVEAQLQVAAESDGAALFASRKAPHGILNIGPDGDVVRLGSSAVRALEPIFLRQVGPGIG